MNRLRARRPARRVHRREQLEGRQLLAGDSLLISEIMAANGGTLITRTRLDVDDPFIKGNLHTPDWIEVQNSTDRAVDVSGYHLTNNANNPTKWSTSNGTVILSFGRQGNV